MALPSFQSSFRHFHKTNEAPLKGLRGQIKSPGLNGLGFWVGGHGWREVILRRP